MRLRCHYCALPNPPADIPHNPDSLALVTVHDLRGCLHVCWRHAIWRSTTSGGFGHGKDCPYHGGKDG